jgi:hypothetical protein
MKTKDRDAKFSIHASVGIRNRMYMKTEGIRILKGGKLAISLREIQLAAPVSGPHPAAGVPQP